MDPPTRLGGFADLQKCKTDPHRSFNKKIFVGLGVRGLAGLFDVYSIHSEVFKWLVLKTNINKSKAY